MNPHLFRYRPVTVEARHIVGTDWEMAEDIATWCGGQTLDSYLSSLDTAVIFMPSRDEFGDIAGGDYAQDDDWIVRDMFGRFRVMPDALFHAVFEPVVNL